MKAEAREWAADRLAIERLHYEYVWQADGPEGPNLPALVACFTHDAHWRAPDFGKYCNGREEIAAHFAVSPFLQPKHHFITNIRIDPNDGGDRAASTAYLMMYSRLPGVDGGEPRLVTRTSRYSTTLVKAEGRWLFDSMEISFQYGDPLKKA